jgi:hypothetical protein
MCILAAGYCLLFAVCTFLLHFSFVSTHFPSSLLLLIRPFRPNTTTTKKNDIPLASFAIFRRFQMDLVPFLLTFCIFFAALCLHTKWKAENTPSSLKRQSTTAAAASGKNFPSLSHRAKIAATSDYNC